MVAALGHGDLGVAAVHDDDVLDAGCPDVECLVDVDLQRRGGAAAISGICGDDETGLGILTAVDDRVG